jgi:hypothetical protein
MSWVSLWFWRFMGLFFVVEREKCGARGCQCRNHEVVVLSKLGERMCFAVVVFFFLLELRWCLSSIS